VDPKLPVPTHQNGTNDMTSAVKYVPDDSVTSAVEVLRKLMPHDRLWFELHQMIHEEVNAQLKTE
jgi:hypothetical protein